MTSNELKISNAERHISEQMMRARSLNAAIAERAAKVLKFSRRMRQHRTQASALLVRQVKVAREATRLHDDLTVTLERVTAARKDLNAALATVGLRCQEGTRASRREAKKEE